MEYLCTPLTRAECFEGITLYINRRQHRDVNERRRGKRIKSTMESPEARFRGSKNEFTINCLDRWIARYAGLHGFMI